MTASERQRKTQQYTRKGKRAASVTEAPANPPEQILVENPTNLQSVSPSQVQLPRRSEVSSTQTGRRRMLGEYDVEEDEDEAVPVEPIIDVCVTEVVEGPSTSGPSEEDDGGPDANRKLSTMSHWGKLRSWSLSNEVEGEAVVDTARSLLKGALFGGSHEANLSLVANQVYDILTAARLGTNQQEETPEPRMKTRHDRTTSVEGHSRAKKTKK
ncbi:hypothetical protein LguiA_033321 [Lonicera macranthoides]